MSFDFESNNHLEIYNYQVSERNNIFVADECLTDSEYEDEEQQEGWMEDRDEGREDDREEGREVFREEGGDMGKESREKCREVYREGGRERAREEGREVEGREGDRKRAWEESREVEGREDSGSDIEEGRETEGEGRARKEHPKKKAGRPRGSKENNNDLLLIVSNPRRPAKPSPVFQPRNQKTAGVLPKQKDPSSTSSRTSFYLVGKPPLAFTFSKLPKNDAVLGRFLLHLEDKSMRDASTAMVGELKAVWLHHFGPQLILGRELGRTDKKEQETLKIVDQDHRISETVVNLFRRWKNIEKDSRRLDRSSKPTFQAKLQKLKEDLQMPLNIAKQKAADIIRSSGIKDWQEEVAYLSAQLSKEQVGCPGPMDFRQKKRDNRLLKTMSVSDQSAAKRQAEEDNLERLKKEENNQEVNSNEMEEKKDEEDKTYKNKKADMQGGKRKINVMGPISLTADARNLSLRDSVVMAASVSKAMGVNIDDTNISKSTAWYQRSKERVKRAEKVMDEFVCPDKVVVHWDGKTLTPYRLFGPNGVIWTSKITLHKR